MNYLGIETEIKNIPKLDEGFIPLYKFNKAFLKTATVPIGIAVERYNGETASVRTFVHGTEAMKEADEYYIDRLVKTFLWMKGGYRVLVCGDEAIFTYLKSAFCAGGRREFDALFMQKLFEHPFEIVKVDDIPENYDVPKKIGGHLDGCRIGFDAGGSDRKVSALLDGEVVYDEETVWYPKLNDNPQYHYDGIVSAFKSAAAHLPRVDAVGISSAGVYINNRTMSASLFIKVPDQDSVKDIYIRAVKDCFGDIPMAVINDGDVTALAGAMSLGEDGVLGIAMGTSEAGGFVDENGCIKGWLNELAFIPLDAGPNAERDEWSGDIGCGVKYFSQDGVIKLTGKAGIALEDTLSPAEKLKAVQTLAEEGDERATEIFETLGCCLAHTLPLYHSLYAFKHVLLLGRVMSGKGGDILLESCRKVLADEYPELLDQIALDLPDEKFRRLGQSATAASLPEAIK